MRHDRKLGLVLGAGAARGWAHIGVLQGLAALDMHPDIICGCSSGAVVGASYATGRLETLTERVTRMTLREMIGTLDFSFAGGGLLEGRSLLTFFRDSIGDVAIEDVGLPFGIVATELESGREMWLTEGSIIDAVRASVALPGLLVPFAIRGRWLIDGALVNPLPVSLCRALGADVIIAVSLNGSLFSAETTAPRAAVAIPDAVEALPRQSSWLRWQSWGLPLRWSPWSGPAEANAIGVPAARALQRPTYLEVMTKSFFTVQDFISRVRMAADPADVLIAPRISNIGLLDFHRGAEAIAAGRYAVDAHADAILSLKDVLGPRPSPPQYPTSTPDVQPLR
jgi:NTE family protein